MALSELTIPVNFRYIHGWIVHEVEYAIVEISVGNEESEIFLFSTED